MYISFMRSTPGYEIHRGLKPSNIPLLAGSAYLNVEEIIKIRIVFVLLTCLHVSGFVFEFAKEMLNVRLVGWDSLPIYQWGVDHRSQTIMPECLTWSDPCLCVAGLSRQFHGEIKQVGSVVQ